MSQETQQKTAAENEAARKSHQKRWEDEASERDSERSLGKKVLGMGKTSAEEVMLEEAHKDLKEHNETHPEVPTLTYEKHPEYRYGRPYAGPIDTYGRSTARTHKIELGGEIDQAQDKAWKVIHDANMMGGFVKNAEVRMPDGSLVTAEDFVAPTVERQKQDS